MKKKSERKLQHPAVTPAKLQPNTSPFPSSVGSIKKHETLGHNIHTFSVAQFYIAWKYHVINAVAFYSIIECDYLHIFSTSFRCTHIFFLSSLLFALLSPQSRIFYLISAMPLRGRVSQSSEHFERQHMAVVVSGCVLRKQPPERKRERERERALYVLSSTS